MKSTNKRFAANYAYYSNRHTFKKVWRLLYVPTASGEGKDFCKTASSTNVLIYTFWSITFIDELLTILPVFAAEKPVNSVYVYTTD